MAYIGVQYFLEPLRSRNSDKPDEVSSFGSATLGFRIFGVSEHRATVLFFQLLGFRV